MTRGARRLAYYRQRAAATAGATRRRYEEDATRELEALHAAHQCEDCGTPLQDPVSRRRGVGPSCWAKRQRHQLPPRGLAALAESYFVASVGRVSEATIRKYIDEQTTRPAKAKP